MLARLRPDQAPDEKGEALAVRRIWGPASDSRPDVAQTALTLRLDKFA